MISGIPRCRNTSTGAMSERGVPYTSLYCSHHTIARKSASPSLISGESNTARNFARSTFSTQLRSHLSSSGDGCSDGARPPCAGNGTDARREEETRFERKCRRSLGIVERSAVRGCAGTEGTSESLPFLRNYAL